MSAKMMGKIWDIDLPHHELLILLAMADHADHEGEHIHPSIALIAWKVGISERQTQRIVKQLVHEKILIPINTRPGFTTEYALDLSAAPLKAPLAPALTKERRRTLLTLLLARDGAQCHYCKRPGQSATDPDEKPWHIDRIIPGAYGGRYDPENLALSCALCNQSKGPSRRKRYNMRQHTPVAHDTPVAHYTPVMGDTGDNLTLVTNGADSGDISDMTGVTSTRARVGTVSKEPSLEPSKKTKESLSTREISGNEFSLPDTPPVRNGVAMLPKGKTKKSPAPLPIDDWVYALLLEYSDRFDLDALNDDAWWTDVGNSLPEFGREWVELAFADLSGWLRENPRRRPHTARGWKCRMRYSLNRYYDKTWSRRLTNGKPAPR